jgi:hypothetical protein
MYFLVLMFFLKIIGEREELPNIPFWGRVPKHLVFRRGQPHTPLFATHTPCPIH